MDNWMPLALFALAALSAALGGLLRRGREWTALPAAVCAAAGVLSGLALGWGADRLLAPLLAVCAVSFAALRFGKGGGEG